MMDQVIVFTNREHVKETLLHLLVSLVVQSSVLHIYRLLIAVHYKNMHRLGLMCHSKLVLSIMLSLVINLALSFPLEAFETGGN